MAQTGPATDGEADVPVSDQAGSMASARAMASTLAALWQTRLDLLLTELEEERQRLLGTLLWGAVTFVGGAFALMAIAALVVVLCWDTHRVLALSAIAAIFLAATVAAAWQARRFARRRERFLAATLAELEADRQRLFSQEQM